MGGLTGNFQRSWQASVSVSVPLFDGGARKEEVAIALDALEASERDLRLEERRVLQSARRADLADRVARLRHAVAKDRVAQAEEEFRVERARYEAGEGILADLLAAQTRRTEARIEVVRTLGAWAISRIEYLEAIGLDPYDFLSGRRR